MSEDLAHDAHLRAALRHAPDHALSPPSGLTHTILAAARQAHLAVPSTPAPPPPRMRPASAPGFHLRLPRLLSPRWAGAWAVALVAALGLGLWLDLGHQPDLGPQVVAANAPTSTLPAATETPGVAPPRAPADEIRRADVKEAKNLAAERAPEPAQATPPRSRPAEPPSGSERGSERANTQLHEAAARRRLEVAAATAARADDSLPAAPRGVGAAPDASRDAAPAGAMGAAADSVASAQAAPEVADRAVQRPGGPSTRRALALRADTGTAPDPSSLSPLLALLRRAQGEIAAGSARWTWSAPGRPMITPFDRDAQAWLSGVAQATQGRWSDTGERGESLEAGEARWWRDGWPQATLRIEADGVRWIESGRVHHAPLDATTAQRLRSF